MTPRLSVLDLVPVRTDQTTGDAIAASRSLAQLADELGMVRYWVAEHHNMPAVAATNPPVLIALLASATTRIRLGSGGVMLPNHPPLVVAEQFALLEAAFPGRIDLGIGRAPGTDPLTRYVLRGGSSAAADDAVARFPEYVDDVLALMSTDGVEMNLAGRRQPLRATPHAATRATPWLLGSSEYSAQLAASRGLPYVFAHHFAGRGTAEALQLYRSTFQPSAEHPEPRTFLTVNVAVAPDAAEARRLALPQAKAMAALRSGQPLRPQLLVEDAEAEGTDPGHASLVEAMLRQWIVDAPEPAAERLTMLAREYAVDEVMLHPVAGAVTGTPADASPAREQTLRLVAEVLG